MTVPGSAGLSDSSTGRNQPEIEVPYTAAGRAYARRTAITGRPSISTNAKGGSSIHGGIPACRAGGAVGFPMTSDLLARRMCHDWVAQRCLAISSEYPTPRELWGCGQRITRGTESKTMGLVLCREALA